jgi:hypothetical protein
MMKDTEYYRPFKKGPRKGKWWIFENGRPITRKQMDKYLAWSSQVRSYKAQEKENR